MTIQNPRAQPGGGGSQARHITAANIALHPAGPGFLRGDALASDGGARLVGDRAAWPAEPSREPCHEHPARSLACAPARSCDQLAAERLPALAYKTIRNYLAYLMPVLTGWAGSYASLREVTRQDILGAICFTDCDDRPASQRKAAVAATAAGGR
jgi:hypothetical protein